MLFLSCNLINKLVKRNTTSRISLNSLHNLRPCLCNESHLPNCLSHIALCQLCTTGTSAVSDSGHKHVTHAACRPLGHTSTHPPGVSMAMHIHTHVFLP